MQAAGPGGPRRPEAANDGARRLPLAPAAVFFDLDGTLADTAADLAGALNAMREHRGLASLPLATLRPYASMGARGLIGQGFGIGPDHTGYEPMRVEFLERYEAAMCVHTRLFEGMAELLDALEARAIVWGVVSNKVERYVRPILAARQAPPRAAAARGAACARGPHALRLCRRRPSRRAGRTRGRHDHGRGRLRLLRLGVFPLGMGRRPRRRRAARPAPSAACLSARARRRRAFTGGPRP
jgi:hypothetical protein